MTDVVQWLIALVICATVAIPVYVLARQRAPKWAIWAVWTLWGTVWVGVPCAAAFHFQPGAVAVCSLIGGLVGLCCGLVAFSPFKQQQRVPGRYEGKRAVAKRKYIH